MSTLADLERVERELRNDGSSYMGDGWSLHRKHQADTIAAYVAAQREREWQPIETAPKDRMILVWCPPAHRLPALTSVCQWHDDAGFCVCELRTVTHWMPLPKEPKP